MKPKMARNKGGNASNYRNPTIGSEEFANMIISLGYSQPRNMAFAFGLNEWSVRKHAKGTPPRGIHTVIVELVHAARAQGYSWKQIRSIVDEAQTTTEIIRDLALMGATEEQMSAIIARTSK